MPVKNPNPMHPGRILAEIYTVELGLNQSRLATKIGCPHRKVSEIINGKHGITPGFALHLERVLGTTAEMWVTMQAAYDLWLARQKRKAA